MRIKNKANEFFRVNVIDAKRRNISRKKFKEFNEESLRIMIREWLFLLVDGLMMEVLP